MSERRTVLVTGGNKGLGLEAVRRLVAAGHEVWLGARDPERGRIAAADTGARRLLLDVTDDQSVAAAADRVRDEVGHLDVLVNNAGSVGATHLSAGEIDATEMLRVYDLNVFGIVRTTRAFLPLLQAGTAPVIVNVSSGMGSLARAADAGSLESGWTAPAYASSKAAVNMLTLQHAKAFPGIRVVAADPGLTSTEATGGLGKPVSDGVRSILTAVLDPVRAPSGSFTDADGPVAW